MYEARRSKNTCYQDQSAKPMLKARCSKNKVQSSMLKEQSSKLDENKVLSSMLKEQSSALKEQSSKLDAQRTKF